MRAAILMVVVCVIAACSGVPPLVGATLPPYPLGFHEGQGNCFGAANKAIALCSRGIGVLNDAGDRQRAVYAWKRVSEGIVEVTDVIELPHLSDEYFWERGVCRDGSNEDETLMAIVAASKTQWLIAREWAYRVDLSDGKFVKVNPEAVRCYNTALEAN